MYIMCLHSGQANLQHIYAALWAVSSDGKVQPGLQPPSDQPTLHPASDQPALHLASFSGTW